MAETNLPPAVRIATLALLLPLIFCPAPVFGDTLVSPEFRIDWPRESDAVARWMVAPQPGQKDTSSWRSLVTMTSEGSPLSRHLSVSMAGGIEWVPMQADQAASNSEGRTQLRRRLASSDGQWQLDMALDRGEMPYRLNLEVNLQSTKGHSGTAPGMLQFGLGPGIGEVPIPGLGIATSLYSYVHPVVYDEGAIRNIETHDDEMRKLVPDAFTRGDWLGLHSRYFALLINPQSGPSPGRLEFGRYSGASESDLAPDYLPWLTIGLPIPALEQDQSVSWTFEIFSGPKSRAALAGNHGAADYSLLLFEGLWGWMRGLSLGLLWTLESLHLLVPSWGLAICLLAILVRLLLYPLGRWALASQQRFAEVQRAIAPEIREIKQRYRGGEQSERILQLYEHHGVSPLAGLKPLLIVVIQLPVFVALFHVLGQVFEFRDASFLWIESLAEPDRLFALGIELPLVGSYFNALPLLMAVTTLASIKLSPAPADSPRQRRRQNVFLGVMAAAFFVLLYPFPSGMVLYWVMANVLYISQYWIFQLGNARKLPARGS